MKTEKTLVELLEFWRCESPDEWTMDELIRKAMKVEKEMIDFNALSGHEIEQRNKDDQVKNLNQANNILSSNNAILVYKVERKGERIKSLEYEIDLLNTQILSLEAINKKSMMHISELTSIMMDNGLDECETYINACDFMEDK